jgi:protein TonB
MKIDDVMEIYDIPFLVNQSKRLPAQVTKKRNYNVIAALSCSVLIHVCGGYFFLHMPQEVSVKRLRPLEVTTIILSPPIHPVPLPAPSVPKVAKQINSPPRVTRVPEPVPVPVPVKRTQTAPVAERAAPAPVLKSVTEKTTQPLPALTAAASRETAPAVAQAPSQPALPHAQAYGAAGRARVETNVAKDGSEGQPAIGPSYSAAYLSNPAPKYPAAARRLRLQGTATVRVLVSAEGRPMTVTLQETSGTRALDEAALEAVQHWSFVPARRGSKPVAAEVDVPLRFTLK